MLFWHRHKRVLQRVALVVVLLAASPFLLFFGWVAKDTLYEYSQRLPFNSAQWKSADNDNPKSPKYAIRIRMVDDLFDRHKLVGMTRNEVIQLLGPSDDGDRQGQELMYALGPERGFISMDWESLSIEFDAKNRVKKASIWSG
ncbi:MAG TPA: hypothetical protein VF600_05190 [Abditibacteriaceae bacterium]|jgi:hypothetical protein